MKALFEVFAALAALLVGFVRVAITPIKPGPAAIFPQVANQAGALPDIGGVTTVLSALSNNGAPAFGNFSLTRLSAGVVPATIPAQQVVGGFIRREGPATAFTDCTDTGTNIVNAIPGAVINQTFPFVYANCATGTATLAGGSGVTITGSALISGLSARLFLGQVTASNAVSLTNFFSFNSAGGTQFL